MDVIDYADTKEIPGAILLLDIEKAFDSVNHEFLLRVLKYLNIGDNFIHWVKMMYSERNSYVINNGFLSNPLAMNNGIFSRMPDFPVFIFISYS